MFSSGTRDEVSPPTCMERDALKLRLGLRAGLEDSVSPCHLQEPLRPSPVAMPLLSLSLVSLWNAPHGGEGLDIARSRARMGGW